MIPKLLRLLLFASLVLALPASGRANRKEADGWINAQVDIPYAKFVLKNGLTLIVHEDHKAPIAAVNVWYHVGSKNEKPGRTGFAHLFEHLMFNGSEHVPGEYFEPLEKVGVTGINGTTNVDRTNYFENVPVNALDLALFMESDRMGHLEAAITQEKLDEQRGVVQNEKRQGENRPYGLARTLLSQETYPPGHPYSWTTIGSMEDLDAATLDDVKEWFRTYYGAANAVVVVAGDVDTEDVKKRVEHYFGDIPSGPPITKHEVWIAQRTGSKRQAAQDRVPQARIYMSWNIPEWGSEEGSLLQLAGGILSTGKTSRFYKRLVYEDQIASDAFAFANLQEIGGQFMVQSTVAPGKTLAEVERALNEELSRFIQEGPTQEELDRYRTQLVAGFIRGTERIGGFGGKSDLLAQNEVYGGSPDYYKTEFRHIESATPDAIRSVAAKWLADGVFILEVHPFPSYSTEAGADRSSLPDVGDFPEPEFPDLQRATLSNGLEVVLAERRAIPVVNFNLIVDAGYAADLGRLAGTASMTSSMMDEGTATRSSLEISEEAANLGASMGSGSGLDSSTAFLSALKTHLDPSLELYADVILNPAFPEAELERLRKQRLASIRREQVNPSQMASRVLPKLLYGSDHAYSNPMTGSGSEESTRELRRSHLQEFHRTWFRPDNATLVVVGDTTLGEIVPKLEGLFKNWKAEGPKPRKDLRPVSMAERARVFVLDRPGSQQSVILAGHLAPPENNADEIAIEGMNRILGGGFTSRINMNLREDKGWSYGSQMVMISARGQRPYFVNAPVQTDKTKESMIEVEKELRSYLSTLPATEEELDKAKKGLTLSLPGRWESMGSISGSISQIVQYGLADDYFQTYADRINSLTLEQVRRAAQNVIHPDSLVWVIVGDRSKIEAGIRELNYGPIQFLDADGQVIE